MTAFRKAGEGRINTAKPLNFTFDGKPYTGFEGDTLASALLANGVHFVGRSFKYHRPRGIMSAGSEEANALVVSDRGPGRITPNVRATTLELYEGLVARSQNYWPSLNFDVTEINDVLSPLFPAGFYNKTFKWPKSFWDSVYEPVIRRTAGLGPAPTLPDPDSYAARHQHCEVLIVGAGPAGLSAALSASAGGDRVFLIDEQAEMGGSLLSIGGVDIDDGSSSAWLQQTLHTLGERQNVTLLPRTTAIGYYHDNFLGLLERRTDHGATSNSDSPREILHKVRAKKVILAQGAIERPLVFPGNDRPGVMLASAAQTYINRYRVAVGEKVAVYTNHDSAYQVAYDLAAADIEVGVIIDRRETVSSTLQDRAKGLGIDIVLGGSVVSTSGRTRIRAIDIQSGRGETRQIECDALLMSGGWTPSLHLWSHSKGSIAWQPEIGAYIPDVANENVDCIGACAGNFGLAVALNSEDGSQALSVSGDALWGGEAMADPTAAETVSAGRGKAFVDFQNDVTAKDIKLAVREGFKSIEHVKRYTTNGMATDQGKTSNINGLMIAANALSRPVDKVGLTTFRPPYTPTTFGAIAGNNVDATFDVVRKTPIDPWAEKNGAVFEPVSLWRRAWYFPTAGENMHQAVARECKATREGLGIFDASTLGKIEVVGPDAAEFLERMYTNPWKKLGVGRCRYGLLLGEDGYIRDDGVIGRLAEDRFHVTTTTGGAPRVLSMMEDYLQTEWPDLDVWLTSITEQWSVIALNGPHARKLIEPFVEGIDLSPDAFPHMAMREGKIFGVETRLFRVSFTGELGFEINVPAHYGRYVWETLFEAGKAFGITPYGTETMHVLRAEKGFIIVGQDTDGTVSPEDAGMSWAIGKKKKDFVGKRSLSRPDLQTSGRKQLVGLLTKDPKTILEEGAQIVASPDQPVPMDMIGHVTSSYWSEALGRSIALALVKEGRSLAGKSVYAPMEDRVVEAQVTETNFYDPKGERLNVL